MESEFTKDGTLSAPEELISVQKLAFKCAFEYLNHDFKPIRTPSGIVGYKTNDVQIVDAGQHHVCFVHLEDLFLITSVTVDSSRMSVPNSKCLLVLHLNCESRRKDFLSKKLRLDIGNPDMCYLYHKEFSLRGALIHIRLASMSDERFLSYSHGQTVIDAFTTTVVGLLKNVILTPLTLV